MREIKEEKCKKIENMLRDNEKHDLLELVSEILDFCDYDVISKSHSYIKTKYYNTPRWTEKLRFQYYVNDKMSDKIDVIYVIISRISN